MTPRTTHKVNQRICAYMKALTCESGGRVRDLVFEAFAALYRYIRERGVDASSEPESVQVERGPEYLAGVCLD